MLRCKGFDSECKGVIFNCISSFTFHSTTVHLIVLVETENVRSSYASIDISVGRIYTFCRPNLFLFRFSCKSRTEDCSKKYDF